MRVLLLLFISTFLTNCTLKAESNSIHHEFDNWIHMEVKEDKFHFQSTILSIDLKNRKYK